METAAASWARSLPPVPAWMRDARLGFSLRTYAAAMLALFTAFALQLDSPVWSWLTVYIVAQPTPGMLLSKSLYRFIGTITGAMLAVVLIALFAQTPELFVFALALIVAGFTVLSGTLSNFRAYAAVLAAYTSGIVASDAINAPDQIFYIAMARGSCITIGIASAVVVTILFAPHRSETVVRGQLLAALKDAARRAGYTWRAPLQDRLQLGKKLIDEVIALDTQIDFASAESGTFRLQANNARSLLAHIFGIISARRSLDAHLVRCGWPRHHTLEIFHGVFLDFLNDLPAQLDRGEVDRLITEIGQIRGQLAVLEVEKETDSGAELVSERVTIDRMDDLLRHMGGALQDWRDIQAGHWRDEPRLVLNLHRDLRAAWINGLRAFIAVVATGAFWIGSAWPHGPGALIFVSIMLSLFASQPRPDRIGWAFFYAAIPAIALGLFMKFCLFSLGSGFDFFMLICSPLLLPLGFFMANAKTAQAATAFSLVFLNIGSPANQMTYDLADSLNGAIAILVGVLFGTLAFILIFPPDPVGARRYVTYRIRHGLRQIAARPRIPAFSHWETRMYDRVNRLHDPANLSGTNTNEWFEAGLGALTLGNEILRLRHWQEEEPLAPDVRAAVGKTLDTFRRFNSQPQRAYDEVRHAIEFLTPRDPGRGDPGRRDWARCLGALEESEVYLRNHPRLLEKLEIG